MAYYIDPLDMTDAQLLASPAEDPTAAWASGAFAVGDERHVVATHGVYRCAVAGTHAVSPDLDPINWKYMRPTNRWAPFDGYSNTKATDTADITYRMLSRFCNAVALYGLVGKSVTLTVKDATGGTVLYTKTVTLKYPARGYYDYAYGRRKSRTSLLFTGLPIKSTAEITITASAESANTRAIGTIARGKLTALQGREGWEGTRTDAEVDPKTYSYYKENEDGTIITVLRPSAENLKFTVDMDRRFADRCVIELKGVMGRPVPWILSLQPGFDALTAFGFASSSPVRYRNMTASCDISVKGNI